MESQELKVARESLRQHSETCTVCGRTGMCPEGSGLVWKLRALDKPQISPDAEFIAGRIVKHMWIIFVLLPVALGLLYQALK